MTQRPRRSVQPFALLAASFALLVGAGVSVLALRAMDYSRAELEFVDVEAVETAAPLGEIGGLTWDATRYAAAPELSPFREFVTSECPATTDRDLVACVVRTMAERFPHGTPPAELFDAGYQPAQALDRHLSGHPGHCVTRSGLAAAALLSVGIPARVVQLYPESGLGHNVFSYYDRDERRRFLVDPTYGVRVYRADGRSVASLLHQSESIVFDEIAPRPVGVDAHETAVLYRTSGLLEGHALYPEPWLYTRVGERVATFPYTAHFVVVGAPTWHLGWGQRTLGVVALTCAALSVLLGAAAVVGARRAPRRARVLMPVDAVREPAAEPTEPASERAA